MPQVPYSPIPTEQPSGQGAPTINIPANPDAFGVNIGQALEGLGKTVEGAGNELFGRAVALQQLSNETEAKQADANYMIKAGELHANYGALQGKDAVDAYPDYAKSLEKLRTDIRGGLSNDMTRKMYDGSSLSTMSRSIFNGAGHAATQNKQWAIGTAKAQIDLDAKTVEDNPADEKLFQDKLARVQEGARQLSGLQGLGQDSPQEQDLTLKATSKLWSQRIVGLSRTDPFTAAKMLDENKTELTTDDYAKVDNTVRAQGRAVGSANIANEVYANGKGSDTTPAKSLKDMEDEARTKAQKIDPKDPLLANHAVAALHGVYNQDKYAQKQEDWTNSQVVDGAIQSGVKDMQELRANPKIAAAIDALPKDKQLAIPGAINRYNAARDKITNENNYVTLNGLSNNDVEGFLNTDLTKEQLSQGDMRKLMTKQQTLKEKAGSDPRVNRAITQIRGAMGSQLEALGIFKRTESNKEDYDHFTGALQSALDVWQDANKKPATYDDVVNKIAPEVLKQRTVPGYLWNSKEPMFKQEVPSDFSKSLKVDVVAKGGVEPTDEQIYKAYLRTQFNTLYGKKKPSE